jgi:hypothetical protein
MSSSKVVFAMCYCIPYHTENKSLVLEWPCIIEVSYIYPPTTGNPDVEKSRSHAPRYDTYVPIVNSHSKTVLVFFVPVVSCVPVSCYLCCCRVPLQPQFSPFRREAPHFRIFSRIFRQVLMAYGSSFALFRACCVVVEFHSSHSFAIFQ